MLGRRKENALAILLFLALALAAHVIHFPVGTYDLGEDQWNLGNVVTAIIDASPFAKDPYLSDIGPSRMQVVTYLQAPFVMLFEDYERFVALLSFFLYFMGMSLLYMLLKTITDDAVISATASIIFSSSSIWFPPLNDAFALVPIFGATGKAISYVALLAILIVHFRFQGFKYIDEIITALCALMVWVHPLTFLGPGAALIILILGRKLLQKRWIKAASISCITLAVFLPYVYVYMHATTAPSPISADGIQMLEQVIRSDRGSVWHPFSVFNSLEFAMYGTNGICLLALVLALLPERRGRIESVRFFFISALSVFFITLLLRLVGSYVLHKDTSFFMLNRNFKWLYFYVFLLFVTLYSGLAKSTANLSGPRRLNPSTLHAVILFLLFFQPIKATLHTSFGTKLIHKTMGVPPLSRPHDATERGFGLDVRDINRDAAQVARHIREELPADGGLSGPMWLAYKTKKSLVFTDSHVYHFAFVRDLSAYNRAVEMRGIVESLTTAKDIAPSLRKLKERDVDYILFEKFRHAPSIYYEKYVPREESPELSLRCREHVEFENDNFLLVRSSR